MDFFCNSIFFVSAVVIFCYFSLFVRFVGFAGGQLQCLRSIEKRSSNGKKLLIILKHIHTHEIIYILNCVLKMVQTYRTYSVDTRSIYSDRRLLNSLWCKWKKASNRKWKEKRRRREKNCWRHMEITSVKHMFGIIFPLQWHRTDTKRQISDKYSHVHATIHAQTLKSDVKKRSGLTICTTSWIECAIETVLNAAFNACLIVF